MHRDLGSVKETLKNAVVYLRENGLVEEILEGLTQSGGGLKATILGKAIVTSALSIDEGLFVYRELQRSMRAFILDDELVLPPLSLPFSCEPG
jgi:DNA polymerase theta